MTMIYSAPIFSIFATVTAVLKSCGRLLLPLPFFVLLIGCDNQSAAVNDDTTSGQNVYESKAQTVEIRAVNVEPPQDASAVSADNADNEDAGQSLIAAAQTNDGSRSRQVPMISESGTNSALQATLIGDYVGMLPCTFCDGTAITLNLFADGSVLKTSIYENPQTPQVPLVESGVYRQDNDTITIVYDKKNIESYRIQDNHLVMMNAAKRPDADYTLSRQ